MVYNPILSKPEDFWQANKLFYNTVQISWSIKLLSKQELKFNWMGADQATHTSFHKLHLSLSQDNTVFETSLLALNQDTKEYTTA